METVHFLHIPIFRYGIPIRASNRVFALPVRVEMELRDNNKVSFFSPHESFHLIKRDLADFCRILS